MTKLTHISVFITLLSKTKQNKTGKHRINYEIPRERDKDIEKRRREKFSGHKGQCLTFLEGPHHASFSG